MFSDDNTIREWPNNSTFILQQKDFQHPDSIESNPLYQMLWSKTRRISHLFIPFSLSKYHNYFLKHSVISSLNSLFQKSKYIPWSEFMRNLEFEYIFEMAGSNILKMNRTISITVLWDFSKLLTTYILEFCNNTERFAINWKKYGNE